MKPYPPPKEKQATRRLEGVVGREARGGEPDPGLGTKTIRLPQSHREGGGGEG